MMDSHDTNQPLNQGELEEEKKTEPKNLALE